SVQYFSTSSFRSWRAGKKASRKLCSEGGQLVARSDKATSSCSKVTTPSNPSSVRDRKSTRLNSSHVSISYAVFCLKKKNHSKRLYDGARHESLRLERTPDLRGSQCARDHHLSLAKDSPTLHITGRIHRRHTLSVYP